MNWEDLNITITYSYLQPCQSLLSFYAFLIISRWRLNSYNAHSKVLGDVSIDAPSIFCKWKPRKILWTKENKNKITLMNIIDVILKKFVESNRVQYCAYTIKTPIFDLSSSFLSRFNKIFYSGFNNNFVSLFIYSSKLFEKTIFISIF